MREYRCVQCKEIFDEPKNVYGELLEYWGVPCREEFSVSSCCEDDYEEVELCEECGEYVCPEDIYENDICWDCYVRLETRED